jgi:hypothetical protein
LLRNGTLEPGTPSPRLGDTLRVQTAVIVDLNGNPVPDGTLVEFVFDFVNQGLRNTDPITTTGGVAMTDVPIDRTGELHISANSPPALTSDTLRLVITDDDEGTVDRLTPTLAPTATLESITQTPTGPGSTGQQEPTPLAGGFQFDDKSPLVGFDDLYLSLFGLVLMCVAVFAYTYRSRDLNYSLLLALPIVLGGLISYNYYALLLPGSQVWHSLMGDQWGAALSAWVGGTTGLAIMAAAHNRGFRLNRRGLRRG